MSTDRRQVRLVRPSRHAAREAWLQAREVRRKCAELVTKCAADLKAAKDALTHAQTVEADNADEWESLLLDENRRCRTRRRWMTLIRYGRRPVVAGPLHPRGRRCRRCDRRRRPRSRPRACATSPRRPPCASRRRRARWRPTRRSARPKGSRARSRARTWRRAGCSRRSARRKTFRGGAAARTARGGEDHGGSVRDHPKRGFMTTARTNSGWVARGAEMARQVLDNASRRSSDHARTATACCPTISTRALASGS